MTTVRECHELAMLQIDHARRLRAGKQYELADALAAEAFSNELAAARLAFDREVSVATRIILLRSVAHLAREAKVFEEGLDLAIRALNAPDLREHRGELFRIVDILRTYEHLSVDGVELAESDVQLVVSGLEAAPGFARADEVTRRVDFLTAFLKRTEMRRRGMPFTAALPNTKRFREAFVPYLSEGRAASYAVTVRFGVVEQTEMELEDGNVDPPISARAALDDLIEAATSYAHGGPDSIQKLIGDKDYANNATMILRQLSPDDERVSTVGLTVLRDGVTNPIALPSRKAFDAPPPAGLPSHIRKQALPPSRFDVVGRLLEGSAMKSDQAWGTIVDDEGAKMRVHYDEATFGDVIRGYWKHQVRASLHRNGRTLSLIDIRDA